VISGFLRVLCGDQGLPRPGPIDTVLGRC
jgi:hypothetical protein